MNCEIPNCPYWCAESPLLEIGGRPHHHRCAVHRDTEGVTTSAERIVMGVQIPAPFGSDGSLKFYDVLTRAQTEALAAAGEYFMCLEDEGVKQEPDSTGFKIVKGAHVRTLGFVRDRLCGPVDFNLDSRSNSPAAPPQACCSAICLGRSHSPPLFGRACCRAASSKAPALVV